MAKQSDTLEGAPANTAPDVLESIEDYHYPEGWMSPGQAVARARECCAALEAGKVLYFDQIPFDFPREDREFLLAQRQSDSKLHKNVSYRPRQDVLRGAAGDRASVERLHQVMRRYSAETTRFTGELLAPYAAKWTLDYASFRPEEEKGRVLPLHKRNDLLHVDAFPTRPMQGRRILRCFTNINPKAARVWNTASDFATLAEQHAARAGLACFAARGMRPENPLLSGVKRIFGLSASQQSAYDQFMLRFHDYLKEQTDFQENSSKIRIEFPPCSTWLCFTDSVPHAVLSGQFALEQTFIVPLAALVTPEKAPIRILERLAGSKLAPPND